MQTPIILKMKMRNERKVIVSRIQTTMIVTLMGLPKLLKPMILIRFQAKALTENWMMLMKIKILLKWKSKMIIHTIHQFGILGTMFSRSPRNTVKKMCHNHIITHYNLWVFVFQCACSTSLNVTEKAMWNTA